MRLLAPSLVVILIAYTACTGGGGSLDGDGGATSSSGASSGSTGGASEQLRASDFSQTCSADGDCVVVYEGAICNACACANAAIARTSQADYVARRQAANCPQTDIACANDCITMIATCTNGKCGAASSTPGGAEDAGN